MVNAREYSAGLCISTRGNWGKCVEPCFRSIEPSADLETLESIYRKYQTFC